MYIYLIIYFNKPIYKISKAKICLKRHNIWFIKLFSHQNCGFFYVCRFLSAVMQLKYKGTGIYYIVC